MADAPGLNESTTTTLRNRKMDSKTDKVVKDAQKGTHVKAGDAAKTSTKKGALGIMIASPTVFSSDADDKYEGSYKDMMADSTAARRKGITTEQYENSAADRLADAAGERRMKAEEPKSEGASHKAGTPAFGNTPKASHSWGHPTSARDGHLRNSGHSGAHRIGGKKK